MIDLVTEADNNRNPKYVTEILGCSLIMAVVPFISLNDPKFSGR